MERLAQFPSFSADVASNNAIVLMSRSLTFSQLERRTAKLIDQLIGDTGPFRLPAGSLVAFIGTVELEIPELYMAAWGAGLRLLPIPDILTGTEVNEILDDYKPEVLFCTRAHWPKIMAPGSRPELASRVFVWDVEGPEPASVPSDCQAYEELIHGWEAVDVAEIQDRCRLTRHREDEEDFAYFLTSGTTGKPKLVRMSRFYYQDVLGINRNYFFSGVERGLFLGYQSFAWLGGVMTFMAFLTLNRPVVMIRGYNFQAYRAAILEHNPTHLFWLPMCFEDMCNLPNNQLQEIRESGIREVIYGGTCFPLSLVRRGVETFPNISIIQGYGSTEAGLMGKLSKQDHLDWFRYLDENPKAERILPTLAIGNSHENNAGISNIKILDPVTKAELPQGMTGDILVEPRSRQACSGYLNAPDKENELFINMQARGSGGYLPGDSGRIISAKITSQDGVQSATRLFLCCEGRTKDVVVTRTGYNVYSSEIVHALSTHPALKGSQTAIAGVKDAQGMFDEVCCWISVKATSMSEVGEGKAVGAQDIRNFLCGLLAEYKVPTHFRFVEKIPLNRNGKIDARHLARTFHHVPALKVEE